MFSVPVNIVPVNIPEQHTRADTTGVIYGRSLMSVLSSSALFLAGGHKDRNKRHCFQLHSLARKLPPGDDIKSQKRTSTTEGQGRQKIIYCQLAKIFPSESSTTTGRFGLGAAEDTKISTRRVRWHTGARWRAPWRLVEIPAANVWKPN